MLSELASSEPELRLLYTTPESLCKQPTLRDYLKVLFRQKRRLGRMPQSVLAVAIMWAWGWGGGGRAMICYA